MTCDQPFITTQTLRDIATEYRLKFGRCVASLFNNTLGTPALFSYPFFSRLKQLNNGGAKQLLEVLGDAVTPYQFPLGEIDIDTPTDYAHFLNSAPSSICESTFTGSQLACAQDVAGECC